jgi:amidase
VSIKDTFKVRGYDTSIGLAALACNTAKDDSILVKCLYDAGAILYCKTNVPQTLMALDTHNNVFGRTINPCNVAVTAGGSSGGEGALLAMRGSVLGVGTDIAGSIRIPAMCNGVYGIKASWERLPYAGQEDGTPPGLTKVSIPASVGPLAHSIRDLELFFRAILEKQPWNRDPDVVPMPWSLQTRPRKRNLRIGIVRTDGLITPHPPIARLLDEVKTSLLDSCVEVAELDIAPLFSQCQRLAHDLFGIEGGNTMRDLLDATGEPLSPWLVGRFERRKRLDLESICALHARREQLRQEFLSIWRDKDGTIDALVCPVAPHPVPPIDHYNGLSYTSSFVLLDYPAGVIPVRAFEHNDMRGAMRSSQPLGGWDEANRKLCMYLHILVSNRTPAHSLIGTDFDRSVYIGTPLCVQVIVPTLMEEKLVEAMTIVDNALKDSRATSMG